jgi:hypothetical protein
MLFLEWYEDSPKKPVAQRLTEARRRVRSALRTPPPR